MKIDHQKLYALLENDPLKEPKLAVISAINSLDPKDQTLSFFEAEDIIDAAAGQFEELIMAAIRANNTLTPAMKDLYIESCHAVLDVHDFYDWVRLDQVASGELAGDELIVEMMMKFQAYDGLMCMATMPWNDLQRTFPSVNHSAEQGEAA